MGARSSSATATAAYVVYDLGRLAEHGRSVPVSVQHDNRVRNAWANLSLSGCALTLDEARRVVAGQPVGALEEEVEIFERLWSMYVREPRIDPFSWSHWTQTALLLHAEEVFGAADAQRRRQGSFACRTWFDQVRPVFAGLAAQSGDPMEAAAVFLWRHHRTQRLPYSDLQARWWVRLVLGRTYPMIRHCPVEWTLRHDAARFRRALAGDVDAFVAAFVRWLSQSVDALLARPRSVRRRAKDRLALAQEHFGDAPLTRKAYMQLFADMAPATASRDLRAGLEWGLLEKQGVRARTVYRFVKPRS